MDLSDRSASSDLATPLVKNAVANTPATIRVELSERSYDIIVGADSLKSLPEHLGKFGCRRAVVISDSTVDPLFGPAVSSALAAATIKCDRLTVPAGEDSKSVRQAEQLWNQLLELGADRSTVVLALGGGVVGDLAGFVAATFVRGLRFVQVPTTLLAQVDSAIGGKVGINLPAAKNMVGAFWQPLFVLADTSTLRTLPDREYQSGLAEVVKYAVIMDADFFTTLEQHVGALLSRDPAVLADVVAHCCRLKADVVQSDERETSGRRAILNYGHTIGHALETVAGYGEFLHGEAVSIGMMCEARLAQLLNRVDESFTQRQANLLSSLRLPIAMPPVDAERLISAIKHDKKVKDGKLHFVLPTQMGVVEIVESVQIDDIRKGIA